ncbi:hypothetical protein SNOG_02462 [Parastagonospora nodorum SN15]|uniref:Pathway-specific nitrogen regulator n=1 Tax=Phaeosphaeria nodorum (strain SN15 / ATCC MYA-4574 / FGSC 10173) TaxID=321614 RepID=Q0V0K2_PHANO|nr:hypothetical protein SNOG_02462 [Parastagonospora nodorum SN15]EAT90674.2 hypothetical protein SNOG_02462 [Parastagonospora nodorum SN15]
MQKRHTIAMSTTHRSPAPGLTSFAIYEDPEEKELLSPSEVFDGDMSFNSELSVATDESIPSMDLDEECEHVLQPYRSSYTSRKSTSSPRHSAGAPSYGIVSALPSEGSISSHPAAPSSDIAETRYTPRKDRSRFRNPESIRAMQMSSPPLPTVETSRERLKGSYKLMTPSRSGRVMPEWLVENFKLLEEKLQDIILMRRGLLIPHPRDEYDLLEERILESLELKTPRLLKCGHFVPPEEDTDKEEDDDDRSVDDNTGRGSRMSGGTFTEEHECADCHHELKRPGKGVGAGTRRWDIKIYAANGLMRANAWAACWGEMERCDVELQPWIPDDLRKTLEKRMLEEQEADKRKHMYAIELQRQIQESTSKQKIAEEEEAERRRLEEVELQKSFEAAAAALQRSRRKKFEEAIEEKIQEAKESMRVEVEAQAQAEASALAERLRSLESALQEQKKPMHASGSKFGEAQVLRAADIPLGTLMKNYVLVLLKDPRNFIILALGALVVVLAMNMGTQPQLQMASIEAESSLQEPVHTVAFTTTATTTATSFSTLTVTEVQTATSIHEIAVPTSGCSVAEEPMLIAEDGTSPALSSTSEEVQAAEPVFEREVDNTPNVPEAVQEPAEQDAAPVEDQTNSSHSPIFEEPKSASNLGAEDTLLADGICLSNPIFLTPSLECAA